MSTKPITVRTRFIAERFHAAGNGDEVFGYDDEETTETKRTLRIDRETNDLLGKPDRLTVTLEPGDRLNVESLVTDPNWKFVPTDPGCGLKTFIGEAIGAASMCWETPEGAGVFDSTRAQTIVESVYDRAMSPEGARLGMATTEQLLKELEARVPQWFKATMEHTRANLTADELNYRTVDHS